VGGQASATGKIVSLGMFIPRRKRGMPESRGPQAERWHKVAKLTYFDLTEKGRYVRPTPKKNKKPGHEKRPSSGETRMGKTTDARKTVTMGGSSLLKHHLKRGGE